MGIYTNGDIFGLRIYNFNDDDFANILFEKTYNDDLKKIMEEYKDLLENYDVNSIEYHKKLSTFEKYFKLYENI